MHTCWLHVMIPMPISSIFQNLRLWEFRQNVCNGARDQGARENTQGVNW